MIGESLVVTFGTGWYMYDKMNKVQREVYRDKGKACNNWETTVDFPGFWSCVWYKLTLCCRARRGTDHGVE
jgi:hypothetical protein